MNWFIVMAAYAVCLNHTVNYTASRSQVSTYTFGYQDCATIVPLYLKHEDDVRAPAIRAAEKKDREAVAAAMAEIAAHQ